MFGWVGQYVKSSGDNFGTVLPGKLYRSGLPSAHELGEWQQKYGIKTVIDLRDDHPEERAAEQATCLHLGLIYRNLPLPDHGTATDGDAAKFIGYVQDSQNWPILVHCEGGRHRTGAMVAAYRVLVQGWSRDQAYREAKQYGFYSAWGHGHWKEFIMALG